jgi:hypothetical protein
MRGVGVMSDSRSDWRGNGSFNFSRKGETDMDAMKTAEYARALYRAHGDVAEAEVARKARKCEEAGKIKEAEDWTAVRSSIRQLRGANQG